MKLSEKVFSNSMIMTSVLLLGFISGLVFHNITILLVTVVCLVYMDREGSVKWVYNVCDITLTDMRGIEVGVLARSYKSQISAFQE